MLKSITVALSCWWSQLSPAPPPYPPSPAIAGIHFDLSTLDRLAPGSDNWAITWADDGHQYVTWGDGGGFGGSNLDGRASLGFGRIEGGRDGYSALNVWGGKDAENPATFEGKSYGLISIDGVLYMFRTGDGSEGTAFEIQDLYASTNHAASWNPLPVSFTPADFPASRGFFAPTFLQFGKDYAGARDDFVYIYAPENKGDGWTAQTPGEIALARVRKDRISNKAEYEYFAGLDPKGDPTWTGNISERKPVFEDPVNGVMRTSVSYNAGLKRYVLVTQQVGRHLLTNGHIGIYDAPEPWGPWTTVLLENAWCTELQTGLKNVYWNFSNKWLSADGKDFVLVYTGDGSDMWGAVEGSFRIRAGRDGHRDPSTAKFHANFPGPARPLDAGGIDPPAARRAGAPPHQPADIHIFSVSLLSRVR